MIARRALFLLLLACFAAPAAAQMPQLQHFATSALTILTADGPQHFAIEIAETPEQMEQGLMYRESLPPDAGMLFAFPAPTVARFWMKNTLIPLDMLFVDDAGKIVNIHERAVPQSLEAISAAAPVKAVVELNGGTAARLGIKPGDTVQYKLFGNAG
jgi:uncharacterized protein